MSISGKFIANSTSSKSVNFRISCIWAFKEEFEQCCHCCHFSFTHQRIWVDIITKFLDVVHFCKSGLIYVNIFCLIYFWTRLSESSRLFLEACYCFLEMVPKWTKFLILSFYVVSFYILQMFLHALFYKRFWQNHLFC